MKLNELIDRLDSLDSESTIYAAKPWKHESEVWFGVEPEEGGLPEETKVLGLDYFLEVFIAQEFMEDWTTSLGRQPSLEEKCDRIIDYASFDA